MSRVAAAITRQATRAVLVRDASNVPVEPGNDLPPPGVVCVRGFARQPPIPDRAPS
jgi:hypothetical protein